MRFSKGFHPTQVRLVAPAFYEAFFTHTSTSPNYQILGSLDVGRRQCALEGYALVRRQIEMAQAINATLAATPGSPAPHS